jgi:hypothetical protein
MLLVKLNIAKIISQQEECVNSRLVLEHVGTTSVEQFLDVRLTTAVVAVGFANHLNWSTLEEKNVAFVGIGLVMEVVSSAADKSYAFQNICMIIR